MTFNLWTLLIVIVLLVFNFFKSQQLPLPQIESLGQKTAAVTDFLFKYGYVPKDDFRLGSMRTADYLKDSIKRMQRFAGLPATGEIDEATYNLTQMPRCGVPDYYPSDTRNRVKRYVLKGPKWDKRSLTWRLNGTLPLTMTRVDIEREIDRAFYLWSRHTNLNFYQSDAIDADIIITFLSRDHGDGQPFDGPGNVLGHGFFPGSGQGGDTHFDADEIWIKTGTFNPAGTGLFGVAAHEFGHVLGLSHSPIQDALMYPYYVTTINFDFRLPRDDINGIQALYGARGGLPWPDPTTRPPNVTPKPPIPGTSATPPTITDKPLTCDTYFDAITTFRTELYIFRGRYFWRLTSNKQLMPGNQPFSVGQFWKALDDVAFEKIDAAYERPLDGKLVIFIGRQYFVFDGLQLEPGYPQPIQTLGLPDDLESVDAVTTWSYNNLVYIFAGDKYWRFDEGANRVELDYPRSMKIWKGVPTNLDAALHWLNGKTYFFKGKGFWQFDDRTMSVTPNSPQSSVHYWFDPVCANADYPDLNEILGASQPSVSAAIGSVSSTILITFSYFACLSVMLGLIFIFNKCINMS